MAWLSVLAGVSVGSFLNVVADRLPTGESVLVSRSHCATCHTTLGFRDLVPVLSYLWLRGRCRHCRAPIPARLPIVEGATGLLFAVVLLEYGTTLAALVVAAAGSLLLVLAVTDLEHGLVPYRLVLPGALAALAVAPLWPALGVERHLGSMDGALGSLASSLAAGAAALVLFVAILAASRGGLGWGDVKLAALLGLLLGLAGVAVALWIAVVTGGLAGGALLLLRRRGRKDAIPFAPFLALGGILALLWAEGLGSWYLGLWEALAL